MHSRCSRIYTSLARLAMVAERSIYIYIHRHTSLVPLAMVAERVIYIHIHAQTHLWHLWLLWLSPLCTSLHHYLILSSHLGLSHSLKISAPSLQLGLKFFASSFCIWVFPTVSRSLLPSLQLGLSHNLKISAPSLHLGLSHSLKISAPSSLLICS